MARWVVQYLHGQEEVEARDQWDAWDKVIGKHQERIGLCVSAKPLGASDADSFPIAGVRLAVRYGYLEHAKRLDDLAISQGLPSFWDEICEAGHD